MSTRPGVTSSPSASSSWAAVPSTLPTSVTIPSVTATSAVRAGEPVPSTTVPPRMIRSCSAIGPPGLSRSSDDDALVRRLDANHGHGSAKTEEHPAADDQIGQLVLGEVRAQPGPELVVHRLVVEGEHLRELRRQALAVAEGIARS